MQYEEAFSTVGWTLDQEQEFWKRIREEQWLWTCNGVIMPHTEDPFGLKRHGRGDFIMLLARRGRRAQPMLVM